jgi:hypothetical protein
MTLEVKKVMTRGRRSKNKEWAEKKALVAKRGLKSIEAANAQKENRHFFLLFASFTIPPPPQCIQQKNHYSNGAKGSRN